MLTAVKAIRQALKLAKNLGMLVLALWLILYGAGALGVITLPGSLLGLLAIIAGVLILAGR